ncbi:phosphotransferase family protein [Legionella brunensis]|uniref:Phosphotransferase enzyme family protein n=1 Tax=Legionella brunensis TaxID=29422 RepID=A0A0W0SK47_9GAMM|nr:phosphotransferase [Legionella brunensis]KTC83778.1 Phosphotransferase enzyme family protein [Legionella brunensis]
MNTHQFSQSLEWAINYLTTNGISILNQKRIIQTSYSEVHKIETSSGNIFYLKQVPEALFLEPLMLAFLHEQGCHNTPKLVNKNNNLNCFIMTSCGDFSLRSLFKGQIDDLDLLKQGIINYTKIQRCLENKTQQLLNIGILDWRLNQFASLYYQLLEQEQLLIDDGLSKKEIVQLHQLYPVCAKLCSNLSEYKVPETINHCDFHENNMLFDPKTGAINIIDWGEVVLTHPFLSLSGCLWNITYFNKITPTELDELKLQCITPWLELYNADILIRLLNIAIQLNGIYAALTYEQMYRATQNKAKSVQQEHKGSIAGCLRTFYNSVNSTQQV